MITMTHRAHLILIAAYWLCALAAILIGLTACQSSIKGGTSKHDTQESGFHARFPTPLGEIVVNDDRAVVERATTQPSASTNNPRSTPKAAASGDGVFGGIGFEVMPTPRREHYWIAAFLVAGAVVVWLLLPGGKLLALGMVGLAGIVFVYPIAVLFGGLLLISFAAWKYRGHFTRIKTSVDNALHSVPLEQRERQKDKMAEMQDSSDKKLVASIKGGK